MRAFFKVIVFILCAVIIGSSAFAAPIRPPASSLPAPSELTATLTSDNHIVLSWKYQTRVNAGFIIERKSSLTGPFTETAKVNAGKITYEDTTVIAGNTYNYRVKAYDPTGDSRRFSEYSNEVTAKIPAVARQQVSFTPVTVTTGTLTMTLKPVQAEPPFSPVTVTTGTLTMTLKPDQAEPPFSPVTVTTGTLTITFITPPQE